MKNDKTRQQNQAFEQMSCLPAGVIVCKVERPDGTTYEQQVIMKPGETQKQAAARFQKELGNPYGWYTTRNGQKQRYIKRDAYLVCNYYLLRETSHTEIQEDHYE